MRVLALVFAVILAGCAETAEEPTQAADEAASEPASARNGTADLTQEELDAALAPEPLDLSETTYLYWGINQTYGPAAYSIMLDLGDGNDCEIRAGSSYGVADYGVNSVRMVTFGRGHSWSASSMGETAYVHGVGVDTRSEEFTGNGYGTGRTTWKGTFSGEMEITFMALRFQPAEFGGDTYLPVAVTAECDDAFSVDGAVGGDLAFFDPRRAEGTAGAGATGWVEAGKDLSWRHETASNESRLVLAGFGDQVVEGAITTPSGAESFTAAADNFLERRETGAGEHGFDMDWGGLRFYAIWGAVYSFSEELDLGAGLHEGPTVE